MSGTEVLHEIHLLPDRVINQIAAGEVVQRPASVLKELLENSVDAGADHIKVSVRDAGRTLIEVVDNGKGIRASQATKALMRHATSKISDWEDLSRLLTYGFRGEALASIAAVSQMELASRHCEESHGFVLECEGGHIRDQREFAHSAGTRISVRSLFFNVPARRNFLKKDETEFRNIEDEFIRLALAKPNLQLELFHQDKVIHSLRPSNLKQRIHQLLGRGFADALVPVEETTQLAGIYGFVAKPSGCRKTRYAQFFFVNGRYFRDPYLQHALTSAMDGILPPLYFPAYILHLQVEPSKMDVNVHPSKIEVKFEEDKGIYAILKAAVRRSLGQFQLTPSLDFEKETLPDSWGVGVRVSSSIRPPTVQWNPHYNPFESDSGSPKAVSDPSRYWNAATMFDASVDTGIWSSGQEELPLDQGWGDEGWMLGGQWAVYRSERNLLVVNVTALHGLLKTEKVLKDVDLIFRPSQGGINLHAQCWILPHGVDFQELRSCALPLGVEFESRLERSAASPGPKQPMEVSVIGLPAGSSWAEVCDLLEYLASCIAEGHVPERSETIGYLARRRGTASIPALLDVSNLDQISMVMHTRIKERLPLTDPEGFWVVRVVDPRHFFDSTFVNRIPK
jgi:DNA mismatch repair protein MutL